MPFSRLPSASASTTGPNSSIDARIRFLALISSSLIALVAVVALGTGLTLGQAGPTGMAISAELLEWMSVGAVAIVAGAAVLLVHLLGRSTANSASTAFTGAASLIDRITAGDFNSSLPQSSDVAQETLYHSIRRLTGTLGDNVAAAEALAAGSYRKVAPPRAADNAIGVALGKLADYMDRMARSAHRISRGDLSGADVTPNASDTLGQANAAMVRQLVSIMEDVEAMKQSIATTTDALRAEVDELIAGTGEDSDQLRRAADRVAQMTLHAHANASRAATLDERSQDTASVIREGALAIQGSLDALKEVCRKTEVVQDLARTAGMVAVSALSKATSSDAAQTVGSVEDEIRQLAVKAAAVSMEVNRLTMAGVDAAAESHVILDRMGDGVHETRYLVRELTNTSRSQAVELLAIDEAVANAHAIARRNAAAARQLALRVESLTSHSRRLDTLLRRFQKSEASPASPRVGPVLYRTPAAPQPMQVMAAN